MRSLILCVVLLTVGACSSSGGGGSNIPPERRGPPIDLPVSRADIPPSGLCRVFEISGGSILSSNDFGCRNIEYSLEPRPFTYIMWRSRKNREEVFLCYLSAGEQGVIDGIDVFSYSRLRLIRVVLPRIRRTSENTMACADAENAG